jgi:hypothetical protein
MLRTPPLLLSMPALLSACYTPPEGGLLMQRAVDARELYREQGFGLDSLRSGGVTILTARVSFGSETISHSLGQGLVDSMQALAGEALIHPNLAASRLNEAQLTQVYAEMLADYDETNILGREGLRRISDAVQVRYFAMPILVGFSEDASTRLSVFGFRVGRTASANARFQLQIWDSQSGHIVWQGLSDLTLGQDTLREERIRFEDVVRATWDSLVAKIPAAGAGE